MEVRPTHARTKKGHPFPDSLNYLKYTNLRDLEDR